MKGEKMILHDLKITVNDYNQMLSGNKNYVVVQNNNYKVNDILNFNEIINLGIYDKLTGRVLIARIKHITTPENYPYGLMPGYVILGLEIC
jgi:hypothetical protein